MHIMEAGFAGAERRGVAWAQGKEFEPGALDAGRRSAPRCAPANPAPAPLVLDAGLASRPPCANRIFNLLARLTFSFFSIRISCLPKEKFSRPTAPLRVGAIAHCCARFLRLHRENPIQSRLSDSGQSRRLRVGDSEQETQSQVSGSELSANRRFSNRFGCFFSDGKL